MAIHIMNKIFGVIFEYYTPRILHIKSKKVGAISRFLQLCIIGYVIGFAIVFHKGYQEFDEVQSAVTTKVKGVARTANLTTPTFGYRVWDVSDYVIPPQELNGFFVITNLLITDGQKMGTCEEDVRVPGANCTSNPSICVPDEPLLAGDGYMTGNCIASSRDPGNRTCEVNAWCPTENGLLPLPTPAALAVAENFTVFIKNNIEFPKFGVKRRNIPSYINNDTYLATCRYDSHNKFCPIFQLKTIVEGTGSTSFQSLAFQGGVIQIIINWDCNLDLSVEDCVPMYVFRRLDSDNDMLSKGYNFRYSQYYKDDNGTDVRRLYKAFGIKFIITVQGHAGKFNIVPLILNIGSGLALLAIVTVICDIIVLYILKARSVFRTKKYLDVFGDDAYKEFSEVRQPSC